MGQRKPTRSEQGIVLRHGGSMSNGNNAGLDVLVYTLRVSLQTNAIGILATGASPESRVYPL
ncbi:MAG: hypothetical protein DSZ28_03255 [Thiothrix sp.]|nr:MAG: hypothetical protein DSZ28_03255 [Thiothrix sp.]